MNVKSKRERWDSARKTMLPLLGSASLFYFPGTQGGDFGGHDFHLIARDLHGGADAAISPDGRYIVASSRKKGSTDLWMFEVSTGSWSQLTDESSSDEIEPSWAPDGARIAYVSTKYGNKDVWILSLKSKKAKRLTVSKDDDEYPAWAPNGKGIVYTTGPWKKKDFMILDTTEPNKERTLPRKVTKVSGHVGACSYHPTGTSLVCHTYESGFGNIVRLSLNGDVLQSITDGPKWDYKPAISHDGKVVAFSRITGNSSTIWGKFLGDEDAFQITSSLDQDRWPMFFQGDGQVNLFFHRLVNRGSSVVVYNRKDHKGETIVGGEENPLQAAFDSRARRIAYCGVLNGEQIIRIVDREDKSRTRVQTRSKEACFPRWSPSDKKLAFLASNGGTWQLAVLDVDSGTVSSLTAERQFANGIDGPVDWSPDGSKIAFKANIAPYESDIFFVEVYTGKITNVTEDSWYDESPSWDESGRIVFMSTRGGGWTWGLFQVSADDTKEVITIKNPDYTEKNYPRVGPNRETIWSEYRMCDGLEYIAEKAVGEEPKLLREFPGGRWPSYSFDGKEILLTQVENSVEYWKVSLYKR